MQAALAIPHPAVAQEDPDISVVVTAHRESFLIHRTLGSVYAALDFAEQHGIRCELLITLDRADQTTQDCIDRFPRKDHRCIPLNAGDQGTARNRGASEARGTYVAFLDADDLYGRNWLCNAFRLAEADQRRNLILHAERQVFFEAEDQCIEYVSSDAAGMDPIDILSRNLWTSIIFVRRRELNALPFVRSSAKSGFGYEDWHFIAQALAAGGTVRIVKQTCNFVRRKPQGSILSLHNQQRRLLAPFPFMHLLGERQEAAVPSPSVGMTPHTSGDSGELLTAMTMIRRKVGKEWQRFKKRLSRRFRWRGVPEATASYDLDVRRHAIDRPSEWHLDLIRGMHGLEPAIRPSAGNGQVTVTYGGNPSAVRTVYESVLRVWPREVTHVILAPWLKTGGSDLETINYATAISQASSGNRVLVITTEDTDSPWAARLPAGTQCLQYGQMSRTLAEDDKQFFLSTLLAQAGPTVIHNMNSALGYEVFHKSGAALRQRSRLFASVFCEDFTEDGFLFGYPFREVPRCFDLLEGIFADNQRILDVLQQMYGYPSDKLHVHYQPMDELRNQTRTRGHMLRVLWAGRWDRQKRLDLLIEIARRMRNERVAFTVYGSPVLDKSNYRVVQQLRAAENITIGCRFQTFRDLPLQDFDVFLHTAQWEGLPNVLLEAIGSGLPVVAAAVGGVRELISDDTGFAAYPSDDVEQYCRILRGIADDPEDARARADRALLLVQKRHSWPMFIEALRTVPGYLSGTHSEAPGLPRSLPNASEFQRSAG